MEHKQSHGSICHHNVSGELQMAYYDYSINYERKIETEESKKVDKEKS